MRFTPYRLYTRVWYTQHIDIEMRVETYFDIGTYIGIYNCSRAARYIHLGYKKTL